MSTPAYKRWLDRMSEIYEGDGDDFNPLVERSIRSKAITDQVALSFAQMRLLERIATALDTLAGGSPPAKGKR